MPRQVIMRISGDNVPSQRIDLSSFSGFGGYPRYCGLQAVGLELLVAKAGDCLAGRLCKRSYRRRASRRRRDDPSRTG